jgi:hypothetical protein
LWKRGVKDDGSIAINHLPVATNCGNSPQYMSSTTGHIPVENNNTKPGTVELSDLIFLIAYQQSSLQTREHWLHCPTRHWRQRHVTEDMSVELQGPGVLCSEDAVQHKGQIGWQT